MPSAACREREVVVVEMVEEERRWKEAAGEMLVDLVGRGTR